MTRHVSRDWLTWIGSNLDRGCPPDSLVEPMVKDGFDAATVLDAIARVAEHGVAGASRFFASPYEYQGSLVRRANRIVLPDRVVTAALRVDRPDIVVVDAFLDPAECDAIVAGASARLKPSTVVEMRNGERKAHDGRTSEGMHFLRGETELIGRVERRIAALLDATVERGEGVQVLHYTAGAEYRTHYDFFPTDQSGSKAHLEKGGQRVATTIMYLNEVEDGGATVFPEIGLSIMPRKGSLLYFSYFNAIGQTDEGTLHGGAPIIRGEKWIATKWIREHEHTDSASGLNHRTNQ